MKKILALILAAIVILAVAACGSSAPAAPAAPADGGQQEAAAPADTPAAEDSDSGTGAYSALYLCNGSLGDKGFYDNAASGFYRLRDELGWEIKIIEMGRDETTYEGYFLDEVEKDWDLIVSGTFSIRDMLEEMAVRFPEQNFMGFDIAIDFDKVTTGNAIGVTYQSNETGFMGGALAALMLGSGAEKIDASRPVLGFVGSMDTPNINDFLIGYIEGIQYINPDIRLLTSYIGSFNDVPKGYEMTTQLYNLGAQIVYAPASQSILGAVQASADSDRYFVACDNDIWSMMHETDPDMVANILSSTMKNVGNSIFDAASGLKEGTFQLGQNYTLGIKDDAVGLAKNANFEALVPADIRAQLNDIASQIANGTIVVGTAFGMETDAVAALRDGMSP